MDLLSSVVPLETLDGWPPAPPVSVIGMLLLLVGFPLLVFLITYGIATLRPAKSSYDAMQERQALWVGAGAAEAVTEAPGRRAAIPSEGSGETGTAADGSGKGGEQSGTGGASARW